MTAPSKTWVCGRSLAGIEGSNPAGGVDLCSLCALCVFSYRSLLPADHLSRVILPSVSVCVCVCVCVPVCA